MTSFIHAQTCRTIIGLFGQAGITVDGPNPWDIQSKDERLCARIWRDRSLGLGESYMDGWWDCDRLDELIHRLLRSGIAKKVGRNLRQLIRMLPGVLLNLQSLTRCRIIADRHYEKTLMSWNANFQQAWPRLKERYDNRFKRMWEYYLLSSAGAFRSRNIQVWQIVMTKPGTRQPACRIGREREPEWPTTR